MEYNSKWFKENLADSFANFRLEYRFFPEGDFGFLDEVTFENEKIGGAISYWGMGYLGLLAYNYKESRQLMNVMINPDEHSEKEEAIIKLLNIIT